ncbi:MAG: LacI family DNA-binding transcriptional regulator [Acholeplasma sp.]|nr:LacI family DNA-binding transcriptional regulator [Acholeplasma sp.]
MKMTIKELAKLANASVTTVSLVLNDKPSRISEAKKKEIKALAKLYHYQPNFTARNLVTKKSNTIGLLIPDIENLFFSALAKKVEDELRKNGYSLILVNSDDHYKNDIELITNLVNRGVDGLLLTLCNDAEAHKDTYLNLFNDLKTPFVLVDRVFESCDCPQVYFDNLLGGYLATRYLIKKHHKRIACITSKNSSLNGLQRYKGYQKALEEANMPLDPSIVVEGDYRFQSGYKAAELLLDQKIDAVFATNDLMAYGVIRKLKEQSIDVPNQVEVVGYDKLDFSAMLGLTLPSVEQNVQELGKQSVDILMKVLNKNNIETRIVLKPTLS